MKELWKLFDQADITVAHNNLSFDYKKSNTRFIQHGLTPPSPYKLVDTLQVARRHFKFVSNKLDDLGRDLGLGRKIETGQSVWFGCIRGEMEAWDKMKKYNKNDVDLLYKIYVKLTPWINQLVTRNYGECPRCGSRQLRKRGVRITLSSQTQRYQCWSCGSWSAERKGIKIKPPLVSL